MPAYRDLTEEVQDSRSGSTGSTARTAGGRWCSSTSTTAGGDYAPVPEAAGCVVSSLHDGMNLVAKEFVTARDDDRGVLVLSKFTGAAQELPDAVLVNPFDVEQMADGLYSALTMSVEEQERRMRRMRAQVEDHNIYRWAGHTPERHRQAGPRTPAPTRRRRRIGGRGTGPAHPSPEHYHRHAARGRIEVGGMRSKASGSAARPHPNPLPTRRGERGDKK